MKRNILLNPGPVTTTMSVKKSLMIPDLCHREADFTNVLSRVREDLLKVCNANKKQYSAVVFAASGTGAVEAVITSVIPKNKKLAIISNGEYGERIKFIALAFNIPFIYIKLPPLKKPNLEKIIAAINNKDISTVVLVHHETTTGLINPLNEIGKLVRKYKKDFILDAISSYAGYKIDIKKCYVDYLIASSNKCLQAMPRIAFVICNKVKLEKTKNRARGFYFNLYEQYHALLNSNQMRFTAPVQLMFSLKEALNELFKEGLNNRITRYKNNFSILKAGLVKLGFIPLLPEVCQSHILITVSYKKYINKFDFDDLHDYFHSHDFTIYPAKVGFDSAFRIACIGDIYPNDIKKFLKFLDIFLADFQVN